jgi:predicted nucleotidyltransferase
MQVFDENFTAFLRLLNAHKVRYLVVGGYAVAFHGYPRYTGDLDIFVEASSDNAAALLAVYRDFGMDVAWLKAELFTTPDNVVRLGREPVQLDVLTGIAGLAFAEAYTRRIESQLGDLTVPFISYPDLIRNKLSTGRGKDAVDAEQLQKRRQP